MAKATRAPAQQTADPALSDGNVMARFNHLAEFGSPALLKNVRAICAGKRDGVAKAALVMDYISDNTHAIVLSDALLLTKAIKEKEFVSLVDLSEMLDDSSKGSRRGADGTTGDAKKALSSVLKAKEPKRYSPTTSFARRDPSLLLTMDRKIDMVETEVERGLGTTLHLRLGLNLTMTQLRSASDRLVASEDYHSGRAAELQAQVLGNGSVPKPSA